MIWAQSSIIHHYEYWWPCPVKGPIPKCSVKERYEFILNYIKVSGLLPFRQYPAPAVCASM